MQTCEYTSYIYVIIYPPMQNSDEEKDKIEEVESALYSRNSSGIFSKKRHSLKVHGEGNTPSEWAQEPGKENPEKMSIHHGRRMAG